MFHNQSWCCVSNCWWVDDETNLYNYSKIQVMRHLLLSLWYWIIHLSLCLSGKIWQFSFTFRSNLKTKKIHSFLSRGFLDMQEPRWIMWWYSRFRCSVFWTLVETMHMWTRDCFMWGDLRGWWMHVSRLWPTNWDWWLWFWLKMNLGFF